MRNKKGASAAFACCLVLGSLASLPARAEITGATIAINSNGNIIRSTSVTTMAIVTLGPLSARKSYIECYFQTDTGQVGLHLQSKDQRRIEAIYQQILAAAAGTHSFQITAYASSTYQLDGYVANLDSDLVYVILH